MVTKTGVTPATKSSIKLDFVANGIRYRKFLRLAPTKANLNFAEKKLAQIKLEAAAGTFDIENHFPSKKDKQQGNSKHLFSTRLLDSLEARKDKLKYTSYVNRRNTGGKLMVEKFK